MTDPTPDAEVAQTHAQRYGLPVPDYCTHDEAEMWVCGYQAARTEERDRLAQAQAPTLPDESLVTCPECRSTFDPNDLTDGVTQAPTDAREALAREVLDLLPDHHEGTFSVPTFDAYDSPFQRGCATCKRSTCRLAPARDALRAALSPTAPQEDVPYGSVRYRVSYADGSVSAPSPWAYAPHPGQDLTDRVCNDPNCSLTPGHGPHDFRAGGS